MKDNFSSQAGLYAQFRPHYPAELFVWLLRHVEQFDAAWDCGTGNGQVAEMLSGHFHEVYATDISAKQIAQAPDLPNVRYAVEPAEHCGAPDGSFDLIVAAQAVHWFDFERFYAEVRRTLKPGGVLALIGYGLVRADRSVNPLLDHFYKEVVGPYWDPERRLVDEHYRTIPFPFREIEAPAFKISYRWEIGQFIGYLHTWSAVQHYFKDKRENPVDLYADTFAEAWGKGEKEVEFPVFMRIGTQ